MICYWEKVYPFPRNKTQNFTVSPETHFHLPKTIGLSLSFKLPIIDEIVSGQLFKWLSSKSLVKYIKYFILSNKNKITFDKFSILIFDKLRKKRQNVFNFFFLPLIQVGIAACQIARACGLKVLGTAGTEEGMNIVLRNGAHQVFNHREANYIDKIKVRLYQA